MRHAILLLLFSQTAQAQWTQIGGYTCVKLNAALAVSGNVILTSGTFENRSRVDCQTLGSKGTATLQGTGFWYISQDLGAFGPVLGSLTFAMTGDAASTIATGNSPLYRLWLQKNAGANEVVNLSTPVTLSEQLRFVNTGNKLQLNDNNLTLQPTAVIAGADNTNFVITNGAGLLIRQGLAQKFNFPVGANALTYNLLQIGNGGASDEFGVRCLPDALQGGASGLPFSTDAVAASWQITKATLGGTNISLKTSWDLSDELPAFVRQSCALRLHNGLAWQPAPLGSATGSGPFTRTRTGVTEVGYFAVLDNSIPFSGADERAAETAGLTLSPNPTSGEIQVLVYLEANAPATLQLLNLQGETLQTMLLPAENDRSERTVRFEVGRLAPGVYFCALSNGRERFVQKVVIQ